MEGGSSHPFMRRESNKRSFSTMAASHRDETPDSQSSLRDEHYNNEQSSRRRRLNSLPRPRMPHYPGDGLDFRRPVMSSSVNERERESEGRSEPVVIDLTDEDATQTSQRSDRLNIPLRGSSRGERAAAGSSRAQRFPRWGHALIDSNSDSSDDEEEDNNNFNQLHLPGAGHQAPPGNRHPQFSHLRRPARTIPSPPPAMDDDEIELIAAQTAPRRQRMAASRRSTPRTRSVTPYPAADNTFIDLTQDDDDDVVHLNTRQREGAVSRDRPIPTGNVRAGGLGFGHIATIIREQGENIGGRLLQRLNGFGVFEGELQAQQQAFEHFQHNHGNNHARRYHQHHPHHRHGQGHGAAAAAPRGNLGGFQMNPGGFTMNFNAVGFDMGIVGGGNRDPTPKYSPPPEAEKGFTRSPAEDEVVICPNCGDELAVGDTEEKQEIWVIKSCGHVYCGECARNRSRGKSKKGKGKAPMLDDSHLPSPFSKCVVEGCIAPASAKSMVLVYLGS